MNDAKAAVSAKLEDGKIAAERLFKRSRYAVDDGISESAHNIKRHPFGSLATAFAVGAALAFLVPRSAQKWSQRGAEVDAPRITVSVQDGRRHSQRERSLVVRKGRRGRAASGVSRVIDHITVVPNSFKHNRA